MKTLAILSRSSKTPKSPELSLRLGQFSHSNSQNSGNIDKKNKISLVDDPGQRPTRARMCQSLT